MIVGDTVARLCLDGSNRQPKFILPTITDALQSGRSIEGLALEVAFWCRYCAETAVAASDIPLEDERREILQSAALAAHENPVAFLEIGEVFGDLGRDERFRTAFSRQLETVWRDGTRAVLQRFLEKAGG